MKKMNKSWLIFCLLVLTQFTSLSQIACSDIVQSKQRKGDEIIKKIENFKDKEQRLPISLNELGVAESEEGPIYYRRIDEVDYELWYGANLGESVTYDSKRKTWK